MQKASELTLALHRSSTRRQYQVKLCLSGGSKSFCEGTIAVSTDV